MKGFLFAIKVSVQKLRWGSEKEKESIVGKGVHKGWKDRKLEGLGREKSKSDHAPVTNGIELGMLWIGSKQEREGWSGREWEEMQ